MSFLVCPRVRICEVFCHYTNILFLPVFNIGLKITSLMAKPKLNCAHGVPQKKCDLRFLRFSGVYKPRLPG